jgi:hypothetical protein
MKRILWLFPLLLITAGCRAQAPTPTPAYSVVLTATAPASDGNSNPYSYAVYRETITGTTCDAATSTNWKEITTASTRPATPAYTDTTVPATGASECYFMVTYQTSTGSPATIQNSGPSNVAQVTVPGVPTAPALNAPTTTQAQSDAPSFAPTEPTLAMLDVTGLHVELHKK